MARGKMFLFQHISIRALRLLRAVLASFSVHVSFLGLANIAEAKTPDVWSEHDSYLSCLEEQQLGSNRCAARTLYGPMMVYFPAQTVRDGSYEVAQEGSTYLQQQIDRLDEVISKVDELEQWVSTTESWVIDFNDYDDALIGRTVHDNVQAVIDLRFELDGPVDGRLFELETESSDYENRLTHLESIEGSINGRLTDNTNNLTTLTNQVAALDNLSTSVKAFQLSADQNTIDLHALTNEFTGLQRQQDTLDQDLKTTQDSILLNTTELVALGTQIADLEDGLAELQNTELKDLFDVVNEDIAKDAFAFGFFAIFSIWVIGFAANIARKLLWQLSR